ncbi:Cullin binding-domain-containing protein [Myxozyma melibiosi]|uniref:Defective in cullin neddylation protein n=1 Tax=Myxozyma melibiosi TaxID=54550 RepID=A0ABR1F625_9ASCO
MFRLLTDPQSSITPTQRNVINQFVSATGASVRVATSYLRAHGWNIDVAVSEYYDGSGVGGASAKKDTKALTAIFDKYKDPEDPSTIGLDGTIAFIQDDLGIDLEDPFVLALACKLEAPTVGQFSKDGFIKGWQALNADSIPKMKKACEKLRSEYATDMDLFKQVYRFTFTFVRPPGQRNLPIETAVEYWNLLLGDKFPSPEVLKSWTTFVQEEYKRVISKDTWNMLWEFNESVLKSEQGLDSYDPEGAWPSIFDEYVAYTKKSKE